MKDCIKGSNLRGDRPYNCSTCKIYALLLNTKCTFTPSDPSQVQSLLQELRPKGLFLLQCYHKMFASGNCSSNFPIYLPSLSFLARLLLEACACEFINGDTALRETCVITHSGQWITVWFLSLTNFPLREKPLA